MQDENLLNSEGEETEDAVQIPPQDPAFRLLAEFADLTTMKKELEAQLKTVKERMDKLQRPLLTYFDQNNLGPIEINRVTLSRRRDLYVRAKQENGAGLVVEALRTSGMQHYIVETYNTQSLSAYVRELEFLHKDDLAEGIIPDTAALLPPALAAVLNVTPTVSIRGRRSSR